jgi:hypothetical protein
MENKEPVEVQAYTDDALMKEKLQQLSAMLTDDVNSLCPEWKKKKFLTVKQLDLEKAAAMVRAWAAWWVAPVIPSVEFTPKDMAERMAMEEDPNEALFAETCPHSYQGEDLHGNNIYWEKLGFSKYNIRCLCAAP